LNTNRIEKSYANKKYQVIRNLFLTKEINQNKPQ